jgi:two-component system, response regulator, stage 0 sporulation protein F
MARILVIDDDVSVRLSIRTILERRGHNVVLAEHGYRGLAFTEIYSFDAVVVDIFMPGMNGLGTIRQLRDSDPTVKIVAISDYRFRENVSAAPDFFRMSLELGAACYLRKPFSSSELIEAVEKYCLLFPLGMMSAGVTPGSQAPRLR